MNEELMSVQPEANAEVSGTGLVLGVAETVVKEVINFGKKVVEDDPRPREKPMERQRSPADALELLIVRARLNALMHERTSKAEISPIDVQRPI